MKRTLHICQSVSGALANYSKKDWENVAKINNISVAKAKEIFLILEFEGKRVIPIGDICEGFSYETGCPGHEIEEDTDEKEQKS